MIIIVICFLIPFAINELYKLNRGYETVWNGADVLGFYGEFIGAIGAIVLGVVAWQQNTRLLKLERDSFISENSCSASVQRVEINYISQTACSFDEHVEQIVQSDKYEMRLPDSKYANLFIEFRLKTKHNTPFAVYIKKLMLILDLGNNEQRFIQAYNSDPHFSQTAISDDFIIFNCLVLLTKEEKEGFIKNLAGLETSLDFDIDFTLITDKYVSTELKCRAKMQEMKRKDKQWQLLTYDANSDMPPLCFWYGNEIVDREKVKIKGIVPKESESTFSGRGQKR